MPAVRPLRPTDLLAFVAFQQQVPENAAASLLAGPRTPLLAEFLRYTLALEPGRAHWVYIERGRIQGLVTTKARPGADIWDIDRLALLRTADAAHTCRRLVEHLCAAACEAGVQRIFIRVADDTPFLGALRQAGFFGYTTEQIFRLPPPTLPDHRPLIPGLRARRPADHHALFQLYCQTVPAAVRQVEAMTLTEWRWLDGWGLYPMTWRQRWNRRRRDFVVGAHGTLVAWLRLGLRRRTLQLLTTLSAPEIDDLVRFGLHVLGAGGPVVCPVREYQPALAGALQRLGAEPVARHVLLVRALAARLPERLLVPAHV